VVVGTSGWGGIKRLVLGSVSHAVAVHAPCSVELVRSKTLE
jgi:nucleotide-binding universal stress UspA family protein